MGLSDPQRREITDFLLERPEATAHMEPDFTLLVAELFGLDFRYILSRDPAGRLRGVMPCFLLSSIIFGRRAVSLPFNFYGGCAAESVEALDDLIGQVKRLPVSLKYREIKNTSPLPEKLVSKYSLAVRRDFVGYELPLTGHRDLEQRRRPRFRARLRNLNRQLSGRLTLARGDGEAGLNAFHRLLTREYLRKHHTVPLPLKFFRAILESPSPRKKAELFLLRLDGRPAAGVIVLRFRKSMVYQWGAYELDLACFSPLALLLERLMPRALEEGFEVFDLGLTDTCHAGLRQFKTRWGAEERPYHYYYLLDRDEEPPTLSYHSSFSVLRRLLGATPVHLGGSLPVWMIRQLA